MSEAMERAIDSVAEALLFASARNASWVEWRHLISGVIREANLVTIDPKLVEAAREVRAPMGEGYGGMTRAEVYPSDLREADAALAAAVLAAMEPTS